MRHPENVAQRPTFNIQSLVVAVVTRESLRARHAYARLCLPYTLCECFACRPQQHHDAMMHMIDNRSLTVVVSRSSQMTRSNEKAGTTKKMDAPGGGVAWRSPRTQRSVLAYLGAAALRWPSMCVIPLGIVHCIFVLLQPLLRLLCRLI